MIARMRSVLGWIGQRLGGPGETPARLRKSPARVPTVLDPLERRQVLSTATFSPFLTMPVEVASTSTATSSMTSATVSASVVPVASATTTTSATTTATTTAPNPAPIMPVAITAAPAGQYLAYVYPQANGAPSIIVPTSAGGTASTTSPIYYGQPVVQAPTVAPTAVAPTAPVGYAGLPVVSSAAVATSTSASSTSVQEADYAQSLYRDVLGRAGSPIEVAAWVGEMDLGVTPRAVAAGFVDSIEHRQDEVNIFYEEFLHRTPDAMASEYVDSLLSGVSDEAVAEAILDSPAYQTQHQDSAQFVQGLYIDVLGRAAAPGEVAAWQAVLASGESRQAVVADIMGSTEAVDQAVEGFYEEFLHRQRDEPTSDAWVDLLARGDSTSDVAAGILSSVEYLRDSQ